MEKVLVLSKTEDFVKSLLESDPSGHDWWHIQRVRGMALKIAKSEGADLFLVELSAMLHDIDDWKLSENEGGQPKAKLWLQSLDIKEDIINRVCSIIEGVSFQGAGVGTETNDLECKVLQDADRLDAIGAIGIARAFAYGGSRGRKIYDPEIQPVLHTDFDHYKKSIGTTVNHFYEKLLLLKDRMQTPTGRKIAEQRHEFMVRFLDQFYMEWSVG